MSLVSSGCFQCDPPGSIASIAVFSSGSLPSRSVDRSLSGDKAAISAVGRILEVFNGAGREERLSRVRLWKRCGW